MKVSQSRWIRGVALSVAFLFAFETILPSQEGLAASLGIYPVVASGEIFAKISPDLGRIERVLPPKKSAPTVIYQVQDAHVSVGAQENIEKILESLLAQKKLDMLFIEGAAGSLVAGNLKPFKDDAPNKDFLDALFHKGLVNGASKFLGLHPGIAAYGMEDPERYRENLEAYRAVMQHRRESQRFLDHVEVSLDRDIQKTLDPQVFHFLKMWRLQQGAHSDFSHYMKYLFECSSKHLGIDWKDFLTQKDWPQLVRLSRILNTEKILEREALSKEIGQLRRVLGAEGGIEIDWIENAATDLSWESLELQTGSATPRVIAERIMEKFCARGLSWGRYPGIRKLLAMKVFQSELEAGRLFDEIEALEGRVYEFLRRGHPEAGRWLAFYQDYYLLKQALSFELRRGQISRFRAHFKNNWMEAYKRFLRERMLPHEDVVAPLAGLVLDFYARAEAREDAFFDAIKQKIRGADFLKRNGSRHIVVVAGGYHKEGLLRRTEALGIPFNLVTPHFNSEGKTLPYSEFLMGRYTGTSTLTPAQIPVMGRSEARAMIGEGAFSNYAAEFDRTKREVGGPEDGITAVHDVQVMRPGSAVKGLKVRSELRVNSGKQKISTDYGEAHGAEATWVEQAVVIGVGFLIMGALIAALLAAKLPAEMQKIRQQQSDKDVTSPSSEIQQPGQVSVSTRSETRSLQAGSAQKRGRSSSVQGAFPAQSLGGKRGDVKLQDIMAQAVTVKIGAQELKKFLIQVPTPRGIRGNVLFSGEVVAAATDIMKYKKNHETIRALTAQMIESFLKGREASQSGIVIEELLAANFEGKFNVPQLVWLLGVGEHLGFFKIVRDASQPYITDLDREKLGIEAPRLSAGKSAKGVVPVAGGEAKTAVPASGRKAAIPANEIQSVIPGKDAAAIPAIVERPVLNEEPAPAIIIGSKARAAREARETQLTDMLTGALNDSDVSSVVKALILEFLDGKASPEINASMLIQRASIDRGEAKKARGAVTVPVAPTPQVQRLRSEARGVKNYFLKMFVLFLAMGGLVSGCATTSRSLPSRDRVREKIVSDRQFVLPEREILLPSSGVITVNEESLAEALVIRDPVIQKLRFQINIREAKKRSLAGSVSLMPTIGFADGNLVLGIGVEGNIPNLGKISLTGIGVDSAVSALASLTAELSKYWKGEDILVRELAQQTIETAGLELQDATGDRYLSLLRSAYEVKTLEGQRAISKVLLGEIDRAIEVSKENPEVTEAQRQAILRLRSEWLSEASKYHDGAKKAAIPLLTVYGQSALGETVLSNGVAYVSFPAGWKLTSDQKKAIARKATFKTGPGNPASPKLAKAYAARLIAATAAELARKERGFSLGLTGFNFFDSYGNDVPAGFNTKVVPAADQRTDDQRAVGLQGRMKFGPSVRADREVSLLGIHIAEQDLYAVRDQEEERIARDLRTIEAEHAAIRITELSNVEIQHYLVRARRAGVPEEKLIASVAEFRRNQIRVLSARMALTLATKELELLTRDERGLPRSLRTRSEVRAEKLAGFSTSIGMALVNNRLYPLKAAVLIRWGVAKLGWDVWRMRRSVVSLEYDSQVLAKAKTILLRTVGLLTNWIDEEQHPYTRGGLLRVERSLIRVIDALDAENVPAAQKFLTQVHRKILSGHYHSELLSPIESAQQMFFASRLRVRSEVRKTSQTVNVRRTLFSGWSVFFGVAMLFFSLTWGAFAGDSGDFRAAERELPPVAFSPGDLAGRAQPMESIAENPVGGSERENAMEAYDQFVKDTANAISDKSASAVFRDLAAALKKTVRNEADREKVQNDLDEIGRTLAGVDVPAEYADMTPLLKGLVTGRETEREMVPMPTNASIDLEWIYQNTRPSLPGIEPALSPLVRVVDAASEVAAGPASLGAELANAVRPSVSPESSIMEILGGVSSSAGEVFENQASAEILPAVSPSGTAAGVDENTFVEELPQNSTQIEPSDLEVPDVLAEEPAVVLTPEPVASVRGGDWAASQEEASDVPVGTVLHAEEGQATVNPPGAITLSFPFTADAPVYFVKPGDTVSKSDRLAYGAETERENRIRFLQGRGQELDKLMNRAKDHPGTLSPDTMRRYEFEYAELQLELSGLEASGRASTLFAPRSGVVRTVGQGPATAGSFAVQLVPLDEGVLRIPFSPEYSGAEDLELFVDHQRVDVLDWDASQFDLAKGESGQFILTVHFKFPSDGPLKMHGEKCDYAIKLFGGEPSGASFEGFHGGAGFHTIVPPAPFVNAGIPSVPGLEAGIFHTVAQDGQELVSGDVMGEWVPIDQGEQARLADRLGSLARSVRRANREFSTVPESTLQDYDARAARAKAKVERSPKPVLMTAPVSGRVRGVTALDGKILTAGKLTDAGIENAEVFLGTKVDPRSSTWTGTLANDDPYLIPVARGTVEVGADVSVVTSRGVLPGTVYAVIPLANSLEWLLADKEGVVIRVNDESGILGGGRSVDLDFDDGVKASQWSERDKPVSRRQAPPLRFRDPLPASVQEEFQMNPGKKIGISRIGELLWEEENPTQRWAILKYFMSPFGVRYISWRLLPVVALLFGIYNIPKLLFSRIRKSGHRRFFHQDPQRSLEALFDEAGKIGFRLKQKADKQRAVRGADIDMRVYKEIIEPIRAWIQLLLESGDLSSDERDTITTKASELAQHPLLQFSREHFEDLAEMWKTDTHFLVKIRGLLARLSILTGQAAHRQLRGSRDAADPLESAELLRFKEKMADFSECFNEGFNLAHRLIALSQVSDLYPPRLLTRDGMSASDWRDVVRNRKVLATFAIWRFLLGVTLMVGINKWVTLRNFRRVTENMQKLGISDFESENQAMSVAKAGLYKAFHPVAELDELEGNKMEHYYGRWLGRALAVAGVIVLFHLPLLAFLFGLHQLLIVGPAIFGVLWTLFSIWRHVGPMLKDLSGDGYGVFKKEIRALRSSAKRMRKGSLQLARPVPARKRVSDLPRTGEASGEMLMMTKMRSALLDEDLRDSVELIVLLPPRHGENQRVFNEMTAHDEVLRGFHFEVAESDGLFPGDVGQFFAARDLARHIGKKDQIYWFPQPGIPFSVALAVFKVNLAEALRMVKDFRERGMKSGEFLFPGGDLSSNAINYTKNGSNIIIDARLASLNEVQRGRYPVLLGRNGSPRHDVEHIVRRPEELQGVLSQYGHIFGTGLSLDNRITPQFVIPKGPKALVANNASEYAQMQRLIGAFREKTEALIKRYGPFWVDFVDDFAGVVAEFRRQFLENDSVSPNLQQLARDLKTFPDGQDAANPYAKIYAMIGRELFGVYRHDRQSSPRVEAFVPAVSDHLFVSGKERPEILEYLGRIQQSFPELVNGPALETLNDNIPLDPDDEVALFRGRDGQILELPRRDGLAKNLTALKAAAFVTQGDAVFFQRRSYLAASNQGLLDLPVFEHLEPGENSEEALRRGVLEELRDGDPFPDGASPLPAKELSVLSYEVLHERRRQTPSKRKEEASVYHLELDPGFNTRELVPGEEGARIVSIPLGEVLKMHAEKHGIFTPRTFSVLSRFLPEIQRAMVAGNPAAGPAAPHRSEMRRETGAIVPSERKLTGVSPAGNLETRSDFRKEPEVLAVSESIRLVAAIKVTESLLRESDLALLPKLRLLLSDFQAIAERNTADLSALLGMSSGQLAMHERRLASLRFPSDRADSAQVLFLDASIGLTDDQLLLFAGTSYDVVVIFPRGQSERVHSLAKRLSVLGISPHHFQALLATDSVSAMICERMRRDIAGKALKNDYAFIGADRSEVRKVGAYIGNLVYLGQKFRASDPETLFTSLWYLLRSPEIFRLGFVKKGPWEMKDALMYALEHLADSVRMIGVSA